MATGETFGNRIRNFSAIFLSNVTGSHDVDVFDCFSKEAGQILMSALLVLIMKSEAMKAFPHSHGLKVSGFPVLLLKRKALAHSWGHIEGPKKSNLYR